MAKVTIVSEPLIERFGRGFADADERPETPCSGDALNMATAISRGLGRLGEYEKQPQNHSVGIFCGLGDDDHGATILSFMGQEGLDTSHVITLKDRKTAAYVIHREEGGGKRSVEYQDRGPESAMCQLLEEGPHAALVHQAIEDISRTYRHSGDHRHRRITRPQQCRIRQARRHGNRRQAQGRNGDRRPEPPFQSGDRRSQAVGR